MVFVSPTRIRTRRFRTPGLVVALLEQESFISPNSVCRNPVFEEALMEENPIPSRFRMCDHLFGTLPSVPARSLPLVLWNSFHHRFSCGGSGFFEEEVL